MQIPIINGIYATENSEYRTAYPRNMMTVLKQQGVSNGSLSPSWGIVEGAVVPGVDRGGFNWNGTCYRVTGTKLVKISSSFVVTEIADVPGTDQVVFDVSFDYLIICADKKLYYWTGTSLVRVTDTNLGQCNDAIWVDGYTMSTDGTYLIVTELNNPFTINPLKYGSSEANPDPILALLKLRNEPVALNRYTIEVFENIGGSNFPFQRISGAQVMRGVIGRDACCIYKGAIAFLGSGRDEAPAIWLAASGDSIKISTDEIDKILEGFTEEELSTVLFERSSHQGMDHLIVNLPNKTLVYDADTSKVAGEHVWTIHCSSIVGDSPYLARNRVWCYNRYIVGDPSTPRIGYLTRDLASHWGETIGWEFSTPIIYNDGYGAIINQLELVGLPGRSAPGVKSTIWTSYSFDGETWSSEKPRSAGSRGDRSKRIVWEKQGMVNNGRIQRFRGDSDAMVSIARLEADIEPLEV